MAEEVKAAAADPAAQAAAQDAAPETAAGTVQPEQGGETQQPESRFEAKKKDKAAIKLAAKLEKELDETRGQLKKAEKGEAEAKEALMRTAAEYDNYRKRTTKEKEASFGNGVSSAVAELLPVIDTLEMAAAAPTADEAYKKGVEMTLSKCKQAFEKLGIAEIEAAGKPFDPDLHSAVMQEEAGEGVESGTVTKVLQKGYLLSGKVVRHAMVAVAQ